MLQFGERIGAATILNGSEGGAPMKYLIEGRVIPERMNISVPQMSVGLEIGEHEAQCLIEIIKSRIFIHLDAPGELSVPDIRNAIFNVVGDVVNMAGFMYVSGISYEIDSITSQDERWTVVFGTEGHVFDDLSEFGQKLTFAVRPYGPAEMSVALLDVPAVSRANFELRNSIRYPDFTPLHCRLAIEAVRNYFDAENEKVGWQCLRETLHIKRETIELFQHAATLQRHGHGVPQSWEERRRAMQIAWEICHRFYTWLLLKSQAPLPEDAFPKL